MSRCGRLRIAVTMTWMLLHFPDDSLQPPCQREEPNGIKRVRWERGRALSPAPDGAAGV
jgi:hypothetical protein